MGRTDKTTNFPYFVVHSFSFFFCFPTRQLCRDGDLKTVKSLLSKIKDSKLRKVINQLDPNKISALHYASRYDHLSLVKLLVEKGADPSTRGDDGLTPLHHCAK